MATLLILTRAGHFRMTDALARRVRGESNYKGATRKVPPCPRMISNSPPSTASR